MSRYVRWGLILLSLSVLGAARPARADSAYFGWGFQCTNCLMGITEAGLRMEFTSPPEIIGVDAGGPAARAGIKVGDIILTVDGESLTKKSGSDRLFKARPGKTLRIGFIRGASRGETTIRVGPQAEAEKSVPVSEGTPSEATPSLGNAPVRFSGSLDQFSIEVRGSPNVHVVMPLDQSWMDIVSNDIKVKIRRTPGK